MDALQHIVSLGYAVTIESDSETMTRISAKKKDGPKYGLCYENSIVGGLDASILATLRCIYKYEEKKDLKEIEGT